MTYEIYNFGTLSDSGDLKVLTGNNKGVFSFCPTLINIGHWF